MILYLDASALVKEYLVLEPGSGEIAAARRDAVLIGTSVVSRAETSAALAKAVRTKALAKGEARSALESFRRDWADLARIQLTDSLVALADTLAWDEGLRGYDAVHLASAAIWRDGLGQNIVFAAFDLQLWNAAGRHRFELFPEDLPALLSEWQRG